MDEVCAVTGLTGKQKQAVQDSWSKISAQWKIFGTDYIVKLFTEYPVILPFFKNLDGLSLEEMRPTPNLKIHTDNLEVGIRGWVENLDDPETLLENLKTFSGNHFRRKITPNRFQEALDCFLTYADEKFGLDHFTKESWKKTSSVIVSVISNEMNALAAAEK